MCKRTKIHGYEERKIAAIDPVSSDKALTYNKDVLKNLTAVIQHDLLHGFTWYAGIFFIDFISNKIYIIF